jgi:hypothetical protein
MTELALHREAAPMDFGWEEELEVPRAAKKTLPSLARENVLLSRLCRVEMQFGQAWTAFFG